MKTHCAWIASKPHDGIALSPTHKASRTSAFSEVLKNIYNAVINLPKPIRRVCYVQVFAFMGWYVCISVQTAMSNRLTGSPSCFTREFACGKFPYMTGVDRSCTAQPTLVKSWLTSSVVSPITI